MTPEQLKAIAQAALAAVQSEQNYGVPAELSVAQWAIESGWGHHQPGQNCFGIKAYHGCYGIQQLETTEYINGVAQRIKQPFATFPDLAACFSKHSELLSTSTLYRHAWMAYEQSKDWQQLARDIAPVYATDPKYAGKITYIAKMKAVSAAIKSARAQAIKENANS